jgi:hypothetical protein
MPNAYSATCEDVHGWLHAVVMLKKRREVVRFYIRIDDEGHVQGPEKDDVQVTLGVKSDARKTSQYAPVSQPYWKQYSPASLVWF